MEPQPEPESGAGGRDSTAGVSELTPLSAEPVEKGSCECGGPCICSWCGGILLQLAAIGFIGYATVVAWPVAMAITYAYGAVLIFVAWGGGSGSGEGGGDAGGPCGIAADPRAVGLLLATGLCFIFAGGVYIPANLLGGPQGGDFLYGVAPWEVSLAESLPAGADAALVAWAEQTCYIAGQRPSWAQLDNDLFFAAFAAVGDETCEQSDRVLHRKPPSGDAEVVAADNLTEPYSFAVADGVLYFSAQQPGGDRTLWSIAAPGEQPAAVQAEVPLSDVNSLRAEGETLYFKAQTTALPESWHRAVFVTNSSGTFELRPRTAAPSGDHTTNSTEMFGDDEPNKAQLWGLLGCSALPYLLLSVGMFLRRDPRPAAVVFNIYSGTIAVVVLVYMLLSQSDAFFSTFMKVFLFLLSGSCFIVAVVAKARDKENAEEVTWLVSLATLTFFAVTHATLELPWEEEIWRYAIYDVLLLLLAAVTLLTGAALPMVCAGIGVATTAWRATQVFGEGEVANLLRFGCLGLVGLALVLGAVAYAKAEDEIAKNVDRRLQQWFG